MNFLAHTLLSYQDPEILVGNFIADFCQSKDLHALPPRVKEGVILHREIDSFTDGHRLVKESVSLIRPTQRKYSPVVIDIFYDYFLTQHWDDFHDQALSEHVKQSYSILLNYEAIFPMRLRQIFPKMMEDNFLMSCENNEKLIRTFGRLGRRAKFEHQFHRAHIDLKTFETTLSAHFKGFFPELKEHTQRLFP